MEPFAALHAYLSYRDAPRALDWLSQVGFHVVVRQDGPQGAVAHAEVKYGEAVLMVASADADYDVPSLKGRSVGGGLYLGLSTAAEVDGWYARAVGAGGREVIPPEDTEWGSRRARVLDPEGHEWSVGTYRPGQPGD
jgi:uncharacterized glyoxalase superfamily protein PhnB